MGENSSFFTNLITDSYLKFDLSSIEGSVIVSATLHAYQFQTSPITYQLKSGTFLYFVQDDSWNDSVEGGIGGGNQPPISTVQLGYNPNAGHDTGWSEWVLTLAPELVSDYVWSMALVEEFPYFLNEHEFYSREFGSDPEDPPGSDALRPYLLVVTAPVPVPPTVFLLGSGLAGLAGVRRFLLSGANRKRSS